MNVRPAWWLRLVLAVLVIGGLIGAWEAYQGMGAFAPQALADDDHDDDYDKGKNKGKFDHLACYKVYVKDGKVDGGPEVTLFNQFEDKYGVKVEVGELELLCVPTKKVHKATETITTTTEKPKVTVTQTVTVTVTPPKPSPTKKPW
jgi:hypothetical protein